MKVVAIIKLVLGAILVVGILNGLRGVVNIGNIAEAMGYFLAFLLFSSIAVYLLWSGAKGLKS